MFRVPIVSVHQTSLTFTATGSRSVPTHHHAHHDADSPRGSSRRIRLLAGVVAALLVGGVPLAGFTITPAHAQASISVGFRTALQDHGRWQRHSRWGEVWIPANVQ